MHNIFLIANSNTCKRKEVTERFKETLKDGDIVIFFNRFLLDLKDTFWIDFVKKNKKQTLFFVSRSFSPKKLRPDFPRNPFINKIKDPHDIEKITTYGLSVRDKEPLNSGCICCQKENIYKKFSKIFILINQADQKRYRHDCVKEVEDKISFIGNQKILEYFKMNGSFSSGFLIILYIIKNINYEELYLVGFDHSGGDTGHQWHKEKDFIEENLDKFNIKRL